MHMTNLFIYGTLRNETVVKAITGKTFKRNKAVLNGYKSFEKGTGFPYILKVRKGMVNGYILWDVEDASLKKIDKYEDEGIIYSRITVKIKVKGKTVEAFTYRGNIGNIRRTFGDHIDDTVMTRVEEYLEKHLGEYIPVGEETAGFDDIAFLARKEFFECEIQHLINLYFTDTYVSPNRINRNLDVRNLPTLEHIKTDDSIMEYADNYMNLACRFIVFNRLADIIHARNRTELFSKEPYCMYSLTNLVTLKLLNNHKKELDYYLAKYCPANSINKYEYSDYAKGASLISSIIYRQRKTEIGFIVKEIHANKQEGRIPLGAEMEYSNIGRFAVSTCRPHDRAYNNFKYFRDFDLLRRFWRLGGHIDDHVLSPQAQKKDGGFLEFALGKNSLLQYTSKPVSNDIHMLSSLISEVTDFIPVDPHSLHINLGNVLGPIDWKKNNNVELIKCLLLLAGDFSFTVDDKIVEKRVGAREAVDDWGNMLIIVENQQFPNNPELTEEAVSTVEFQFPRLRRDTSYTPLLMGLKGFYLGYNPRPYSSKLKIIDYPHIHEEADTLLQWALDVTPLSSKTISSFLSYVEKGLFTGLHEMSLKHRKKFLKKEILLIEKEVKIRNDWIKEVGKNGI